MVNRVKKNNSDDKVSAYTSWYIIANADVRNAPPTEQTSVYLGTYRDPPLRHKNQASGNIKIDYRVVHRYEPAIVSSMEKCQ
jgi:hypothetical protein